MIKTEKNENKESENIESKTSGNNVKKSAKT